MIKDVIKTTKKKGEPKALPARAEGALMADGEIDTYLIAKSRVDFSIEALFNELRDIYPFEPSRKLVSFSFIRNEVILVTQDQAKWAMPRAVLQMTAIDRFETLVAYAEENNRSRRAAGIADLKRRRASLEQEIAEIDRAADNALRPKGAVSMGSLKNVADSLALSSNIFERRYLPNGSAPPMAEVICQVLASRKDAVIDISVNGRVYPWRLTVAQAFAYAKAFIEAGQIPGHDLDDRTNSELTATAKEAAEALRKARVDLVQCEQAIAKHVADHGYDTVYGRLHRQRRGLLALRGNWRDEANTARLNLRLRRLWKKLKKEGVTS